MRWRVIFARSWSGISGRLARQKTPRPLQRQLRARRHLHRPRHPQPRRQRRRIGRSLARLPPLLLQRRKRAGISRNRRRRAVSRQRLRQIWPPQRRARRPRRRLPRHHLHLLHLLHLRPPLHRAPHLLQTRRRMRQIRRARCQIRHQIRRRARSRGWLQKRLCNISSRWRRWGRLRHNGHTSCVWLFALVRLFHCV